MLLPSVLTVLSILYAARSTWAVATIPPKIYGVNLGSWLVLEPWMLPQEWLNMGGQSCTNDCSGCIGSEFAFVQAHPDVADEVFARHWATWFTQRDVDLLKDANINTVRIPLGYWIVEALVNRTTEFYPRGGMEFLRRGLLMLKEAEIVAILDHHALPGVQTANQAFTGNCTDNVEFYTPYNYQRALTWTAVMTALSHLDPAFASVFSIEAVNEPIMNANQTPGYGQFQKEFVETIRTVESLLGIHVPGHNYWDASNGFSETMARFSAYPAASPSVQEAISQAIPILRDHATRFEIDDNIDNFNDKRWKHKIPLTPSFMDVNWQYNNPSNPANAKIGPQGYDNHLYYSFGGVAAANPSAYLTSVCNLQRIANDAALNNTPLWFGEWGLPTQFDATDEFLYQWADAQKLAYSQGAGWIFWNFKTEISALAGNLSRQWSYEEGLKLGYLTRDPAAYNNPNVCDPYYNTSSDSAEDAQAVFSVGESFLRDEL